MIKDIRIRGTVAGHNQRYEYYANVIGSGIGLNYFYEQGEDTRGYRDRFFQGGNEVAIYQDHVYHRGNGGNFSEYMLGASSPTRDYVRPDVLNRLVMYGARYDEEHEHIIFTNETAGRERLEKLFQEGNLLSHYFFFISGDIQGELKTVQETLLRLTGKFLKRRPLFDDRDGNQIAVELYKEIGIQRWTLFLFKLIDRAAVEYRDRFISCYSAGRLLTEEERAELSLFASERGISPENAEKIEKDALYKHPSNRQLIESYKSLLAGHQKSAKADEAVQIKRTRLRTIALKRELPMLFFDQIDRLIFDNQHIETPTHVQQARRCMESILEKENPQSLSEEEFLQLLQVRLIAFENNYGSFDELLEDVYRSSITHADLVRPLESLMDAIRAHLERYERAYETIKSLALIDDFELSAEMVTFLATTKSMVDLIRQGYFDKLTFQSIEKNYFLNSYGRSRLLRLRAGLESLLTGKFTPEDIVEEITRLNAELRLRKQVETSIRGRNRDVYRYPYSKKEQESLLREITEELRKKGVESEIGIDIFNSAILTIGEEFLYLDEILPQVLKERDLKLRDDFIKNSAIDRLRIEELELEYAAAHQVEESVLRWLRSKTSS